MNLLFVNSQLKQIAMLKRLYLLIPFKIRFLFWSKASREFYKKTQEVKKNMFADNPEKQKDFEDLVSGKIRKSKYFNTTIETDDYTLEI